MKNQHLVQYITIKAPQLKSKLLADINNKDIWDKYFQNM